MYEFYRILRECTYSCKARAPKYTPGLSLLTSVGALPYAL